MIDSVTLSPSAFGCVPGLTMAGGRLRLMTAIDEFTTVARREPGRTTEQVPGGAITPHSDTPI